MNKYAWCLLVVVAAGAVATQGYAQTATTPATHAATTTSATAPVTAAPTTAAAPTAATANNATAKPVAKIPEDAKGKPVVVADNKANFDAVAAAIRQAMQPGGRFALVPSKGKAKVNAGLVDMAALFNQYGSVDKMDPAARSRLLDDQNTINAELARNDANRRVCWQETPVGTHFPHTVCRTVAQMRRDQENANQFMDQNRTMKNQTIQAQAQGGAGGR